MPRLPIAVLLSLTFLLASCGSNGNSSPTNINGQWYASLVDSNGTVDYTFSADFTQAMGAGLTITNFDFIVTGPCFSGYSTSEYAESGSFTFSGNSNGQLQGTFNFTVTTTFPGANTNNVLTLTGTVSGSTISGTWTANGLTGCSGSGTFTLKPPMIAEP